MAYLIPLLIAFIFISKISFKVLGFVPFSLSPIIYQWGVHPFVNMAIHGIIAPVLLWKFIKTPTDPQSNKFKVLLAIFWATMVIQGFIHAFFLNDGSASLFLSTGSFLMLLTLSLVYGRIIPSLLPAHNFIQTVRLIAVPITLLSLFFLLFNSEALYRGGRFIGLYKHIPHMVTCATIAFIFYLPKVFRPQREDSNLIILLRFIILSLLFFAILITGTRSSAAAALFALILGFFIFPKDSEKTRFLRVASIISVVTFVVFFGFSLFQFAEDIARGNKSLGQREAQDGIESRTEEIFRGLEIFQESPWTGKGIIYKYQSGNELEVGNYNSFKDPHNYFVSAGVIGGWPLILLATAALVLLLIATFRALRSKITAYQVLGIYMISHIPILMIYHLHLSSGGMADRLYWLVFGYLAYKKVS